MHDIRALRESPDSYVAGWSARGLADAEGIVEELIRFDAEFRKTQTILQSNQARRNELAKLIGQAKAKKDEGQALSLIAEVEELKRQAEERAEQEKLLSQGLQERLPALPNLPAPDVPIGADEHGNVETGRWGEPASIAQPRDHADLGEALGLMDFEAAARMSGARFVVLKGQLARLERAVAQFMLDLQTTEHGYVEVSPPLLVRDQAMFGTGQLPKFKDDLFSVSSIDWDAAYRAHDVTLRIHGNQIKDEIDVFISEISEIPGIDGLSSLSQLLNERLAKLNRDSAVWFRNAVEAGNFTERRWLIPTAEVSLTNLVREQIVAEEALPLRLTALTPCFRAEAGASGRDTKGMIRQHQFSKVELVSITTPEQSDEEHERMTSCAEEVLKRLELPFRRMLLCTGDMGFSARKTFDLEVWLPSQGTYREISSCSNCGDFQARRMDARARKAGEKGTRFVHTLNGSGLAVGRTLVAIMETYQDEGGRIAIPSALRPYMGDVTHIG